MSFCLTEQQLVFSGPGDRFTKNIAALRLLQELETNDRPASDDERLTLAHYSAFGESALLNRLFHFDSSRSRFALHPDYTALLAEHEAKQLRRAALTAFYTPLDVVCAIWHALERLGLGTLDRPRIIEPAAGVGHFISAMPAALRARAEITAVELDSITARILHQIHPDISVHGGVGFEAVDLPTNWFDLAISNVPFGEMSVHDPLVPEEYLRRTLHDYFFAKALRIVRPGGLVVFLTSWGTMDKRSRSVRTWLAQQAELIGAFRLPNGVFHQTSGSASATDLLLLQKRPAPITESPAWLELAEADYPHATERTHLTFGSRYTREIRDPEELATAKVAVNRLWLDAPQRLIGTPTIVVNDNSLWLQVRPPSEGITPLLASRMEALLPCDIVTPTQHDDTPEVSLARQPRDLYARQETIDLTSLSGKHQARAVALAAIEQAARTLIRDELGDAVERQLELPVATIRTAG